MKDMIGEERLGGGKVKRREREDKLGGGEKGRRGARHPRRGTSEQV